MELPETIGRFEIDRVLGRGAMGVVYLAKDPVLDRKVAVKVIQLHPGLDEKDVSELKQRFEVEARAAAKMSHPSLVTIFDAGLQDESLYLAMEYIRGEALDSVIASDRILTYKETADILIQLGGGLDFAHERGIVHRDIKPANILINRRGQPKITDFGVAREATSNLTTTGTIIGTPAYMSPEQITGHKVSGASDQFSLAVMVYEMLTGRKPFFGEGATTIMYKIVHEDPEHLNNIRKTLPADINGVVMRALAKEGSDRYPSCYEFAEAVRDVLGAAPADEAVVLSATGKRKAMHSGAKRPKPLAASADDATHLAAPGTLTVEEPEQSAAAVWIASLTEFLQTTNGKIAAGGGAAALLLVLAVAMFTGGGSESTPAVPPAAPEPIVDATAPEAPGPTSPAPESLAAVDASAEGAPEESGVEAGGDNDEGAGEGAEVAGAGEAADSTDLTSDASAPLDEAPIEVAPAPGGVLSEATMMALARARDEAASEVVYQFVTRPDGASVLLNGRRLDGTTPMAVAIDPAEHYSVLLEQPGHYPVSWAFVAGELPEEQQANRRLFFPMRAVPAARVDPVPATTDEPDQPSVEPAPVEPEPQPVAPAVPLPPVDPVQVRGDIQAPEVVERSELELPDWAIEMSLPRYVLLELVIDREARVREVTVVRAVHPELERLAIEAVRTWRFAPATRDGVPVDVFFNVAVAFEVPGGDGALRP